MVLGQADRPLLERHLDVRTRTLAVRVDALLAAGAAEHERAGIGRVGQEVVHRAIAGARPPDRAAARPCGAAAAGPRRSAPITTWRAEPEPPPQHEHPLDRVADLLIGAQHDPPVLVAVQPDRQARRSSPRSALLRSPPSSRARIRCSSASHIVPFSPSSSRSLKSRRRIDAVGVGDQRAGQRAQIQQLMPVRRGARQPRDLQRQHQRRPARARPRRPAP